MCHIVRYVNHLGHITEYSRSVLEQGYYLMAPYPVERAPTVELNLSNPKFQGVRISNLIDYPVKGFVIEKIGSLEIMANVLANVCTKLQENNIPHNLLICDCGTRAFLWPQVRNGCMPQTQFLLL